MELLEVCRLIRVEKLVKYLDIIKVGLFDVYFDYDVISWIFKLV